VSVARSATAARDELAAPAWAVELVGGEAISLRGGGDVVDVIDGGEFALASARLGGAAAMDAATLERRVTKLYDAVAARIRGLDARHPVRLWNHIPGIHARMDAGRDRYMVFNAGRYHAFEGWYGGPQAFEREVATASGVGHDGADLVVHCLAARRGGVAVDNPRQVLPHKYSKRFGPLPPCFARGTLLPARGLILVGGTASIRGEESLHLGSLAMQMRETLTNLAAVVESAHVRAGDETRRGEAGWLQTYQELRVYYPRAADAGPLAAMVRGAFAPSCRVEMRRAELCRAELVVEIEGVARLEV
jgi:chorismate lyase/3-hydroxybenzoate synthase